MRKLCFFSIGVIAAVAAVIYALPESAVVWLMLGACLLAVGALIKLPRLRIVFFGAAAALAWCSVYFLLFFAPLNALCVGEADFTAQAAKPSVATRYGHSVEADVLLPNRSVRTVIYYTGKTDLATGEVFTGRAYFTRTIDSEETFNVASDIFLTGRATELAPQGVPQRLSLRTRAAILADQIRDKLRRTLPEDAKMVVALVTGDRSVFSYAEKNRMILAGVYHAVSLSGMHVALLAGLIYLLFARRKWLCAALGIPILIAFTVMTGSAPSTVRATVMQSLLLLAPLLRREYDPMNALCAALLVLLAENPWSLAHWGLQLSFTATLGILLFYPLLNERIIRKRRLGIVRYALSSIGITLCACAFSMPLAALYFGVVPLLSLPVNLLALWTVTLLFPAGLVLCLLPDAICTAAGGVIVWLCRWFNLVVDTTARIPVCAVYRQTPLMLAWAVIAWEAVLFAALLPKRRRAAAITVFASLVLASALTYIPEFAVPHHFTALDVGQGQCLVYRGREKAVIDCGANGDATGESAARYLLSRGVFKLDAVILSHFDADHCDGIAQLISRIPTETIYIPYRENEDPSEQEHHSMICAAAEKYGAAIVTVSDRLDLAALTVFPPQSQQNANDASLAVLISEDDTDILITGDMNAMAEATLLRNYELPDLEAAVAGHHGAENATGEALLAHLRPEIVFCSAGRGNIYGHPAPDTVARVTAHGGTFYTTAENGDLELRW
ncbi:MAG: DNA internalization-related competence protein ComEC/Rec2 [Oscillospiraceae bacterium]|nr:DNA internalization-related competence protein ComEC/Rec2 [Oscillospiraceae bacterium]